MLNKAAGKVALRVTLIVLSERLGGIDMSLMDRNRKINQRFNVKSNEDQF